MKPLKNPKIKMSFDDVTKTYFSWKILKIHTLPGSVEDQLKRVYYISTKCDIEMYDMCGHVTRRFNGSSVTLWSKPGDQETKKVPN